MKRLHDFISEDTNQFGPGTDLIISLMAVLLIMMLISGHMYNSQRKRNSDSRQLYLEEKERGESLRKSYEELLKRYEELAKRVKAADDGGNFKLATVRFSAGNFEARPVDRLTDPAQTDGLVRQIVSEYQTLSAEFPFIFVIGHANQKDDPDAGDTSFEARMRRNWEYAGRRAVVVAELIQRKLSAEQRERIVVVTLGEFDLGNPSDPLSQENAYVEVVFGKEWKPPARGYQTPAR